MFRTLGKSLLILLIASFCHSAELPKGAEVFPFNDFSGGLYTNAPEHLIESKYVPELRNVLLDEVDGKLVTRTGYELAGSTSALGTINFIYEFNNETGEREFIVSDSSVVLTTKDFVSYTLLKRGLNPIYRLRGRQIRNKIWMTNGSDSVFTYDGTTVTVLDGQTYASGKTPNVPKGKYIEYWLERPWIFNTSVDRSELAFADIISTDTVPVAIAPDSENAWPAGNKFYVGRGDGEAGTGLFVLKTRLYVGKERSIYVVFGDKKSNFVTNKLISGTGMIDQNEVPIVENVAYFVGNDGLYATDGSVVDKISHKIKDRIDPVTDNASSIVSEIWDERTEFNRGDFFNSTATSVNTLTVETTGYLSNSFSNNNISLSRFSTATVFVPVSTTTMLVDNYSGRLSTISFTVASGGGNDGQCTNGIEIVFLNNRNNTRSVFYASYFAQQTYSLTLTTGVGSGADIRKSDIVSGLVDWKVSLDTAACTMGEQNVSVSSIGTLMDGVVLLSTNTGGFVSNASTASTITFWDSFIADDETNGGHIDYFIKTATSIVNLTTQSWVNILPGSVIDAPASNNYIMWAATINANGTNNPPAISLVEIRHNEGGSSQGIPFSIGWDGRLWLFVSTNTSGDVFNGYIKARSSFVNPTAWTYFNNMPIYSLAIFNKKLYGGGVGKVYRMDYGTNDAGTAIDAFYRFPSTFLGNLWRDKKVHGYFIDADLNTSKTVTVTNRIDSLSSVSNVLSLDGQGRKVIQSYDITNSGNGNIFSFSVQNNQLDQNINMNAFAIIYNLQSNISGVNR